MWILINVNKVSVFYMRLNIVGWLRYFKGKVTEESKLKKKIEIPNWDNWNEGTILTLSRSDFVLNYGHKWNYGHKLKHFHSLCHVNETFCCQKLILKQNLNSFSPHAAQIIYSFLDLTCRITDQNGIQFKS